MGTTPRPYWALINNQWELLLAPTIPQNSKITHLPNALRNHVFVLQGGCKNSAQRNRDSIVHGFFTPPPPLPCVAETRLCGVILPRE